MLRISRTSRSKLIVAGVIVVIGIAAGVSHLREGLRVEGELLQLRQVIAQLSKADPAYRNLQAVRSSHPDAWIVGSLPSQQHLAVLRARLSAMFGAAEAERIVGNIRVTGTSTRRGAT